MIIHVHLWGGDSRDCSYELKRGWKSVFYWVLKNDIIFTYNSHFLSCTHQNVRDTGENRTTHHVNHVDIQL